MMYRIGFVGYKNSGKTHISSKLAEENDLVNLIGFSDPLYRALYAIAGITLEEIQDKSRREIPDDRLHGRSIQYALNSLGNDWGRGKMDENFWSERAFGLSEENRINVFDNVRYENELLGIINSDRSLIIDIFNSDVDFDGTEPEKNISRLRTQADIILHNDGQQFANSPFEMKVFSQIISLHYLGYDLAELLHLEKATHYIEFNNIINRK